MYVMMFEVSCIIMSIKRLKLAGAPIRPCGMTRHWYWPLPGMVKAVKGRERSANLSCQNPLVKSMQEKIDDLALPISSRHWSIVFMEYLSGMDLWLSMR